MKEENNKMNISRRGFLKTGSTGRSRIGHAHRTGQGICR